MKKYTIDNGIKIIYEKRKGNLTSICIGFNAGASVEKEKIGIAHVVEHMIFKGTKKRSELEINTLCDELFGFNNAMTNYPYAIYYGTSLSEDFEKALELYADIIINPVFPKQGFKEEIDIICEELKEWKDDNYQYCEDKMLYNAFDCRRIKNLIIGKESDIRNLSIEDIKSFYNKFYVPQNCTISVVTDLSFDKVRKIINEYFIEWKKTFDYIHKCSYEYNKEGTFVEEKKDIQGAKIQYCYPIHDLTYRELKAFRIFDTIFGKGTSSILYDEIRTKNGLVYDIATNIKNERDIKLYTISLGTSTDKIEKSINLINKKIQEVKESKEIFTVDKILAASKSIKLKRELLLEKSIQIAKELTVYEIMYNSPEMIYEEVNELNKIDSKQIEDIINKVLVNPTIQVIKPDLN